ncbi:MAG: carbohydrate kinase family protein [Chloroflexota bacterium]|nr:carbohydrate kinase family protein [Chloroflexota bacterium]
MVNRSGPLAIVGNLNVDLWVRPVDRFPGTDEEHIVESARVELAGTAGYALHACSALGLDAVTISTIGEDALGRLILQAAEELSVPLDGTEVLSGRETPLSMVFIGSDGSRSIMSTLGAHADMDMDVVMRHDADIAKCSELFICGSYLLPRLGPADIHEYAQVAQGRGQTVVFDPSWDPSGWGGRVRRETAALLSNVDIYMPNAQELVQLTGRLQWEDAAREVIGIPGELVIKRGAEGACYVTADDWVEVPGFEIEAINTIGAGDVFDMGYLYARRMRWSPRQRLEFACAVGAIVVSQTGMRKYPTASAVQSFLQERLGTERWGPVGPAALESG